jgi:hypothetical protein
MELDDVLLLVEQWDDHAQLRVVVDPNPRRPRFHDDPSLNRRVRVREIGRILANRGTLGKPKLGEELTAKTPRTPIRAK